MSINLPIKIRPMTPDDFAHIVVTWTKSFKQSDFAESIDFNTYMDHHKDLVQETVEQCVGSVACSESDESLILGYCVFEKITPEIIVHYIHTKPKFRRFGIANLLISQFRSHPITITHKTKFTKYLKKLTYTYNPYLFLRRNA